MGLVIRLHRVQLGVFGHQRFGGGGVQKRGQLLAALGVHDGSHIGCGFVFGGLLPAIATSLHVTVAAAGQLVTVFSASYAVLAPVLAALTASWPRRRAPAYAGGSGLAVLLLVYGLSGTVGNLTAGHLADRYGSRRVVVAVTLALGAAFALTPLGRDTLGAAVVTIVVVGFLSFSVTTPQQHLVIALAGPGAGLVTSLYQSAVYLAVSLSGGAGALALEAWRAAGLPYLAAVLMLAAAVLTLTNGTRAGRKATSPAGRT